MRTYKNSIYAYSSLTIPGNMNKFNNGHCTGIMPFMLVMQIFAYMQLEMQIIQLPLKERTSHFLFLRKISLKIKKFVIWQIFDCITHTDFKQFCFTYSYMHNIKLKEAVTLVKMQITFKSISMYEKQYVVFNRSSEINIMNENIRKMSIVCVSRIITSVNAFEHFWKIIVTIFHPIEQMSVTAYEL